MGRRRSYEPNHFFDSVPAPSMTSNTPGLSDSTEGTWFAKLLKKRGRESEFQSPACCQS